MYELAQAPIVPGSERCARLGHGGHVSAAAPPTGPAGLSLLVDVQLESSGRHPLVRYRDHERALAIDLVRDSIGVSMDVWLGSGGEWLRNQLALSSTTGKRLAIRVDVEAREVAIDELQPWGPLTSQTSELLPSGKLAPEWTGLRIGGLSELDPADSLRGRVAEVAVIDELLSEASLEGLRLASRPDQPSDIPTFDWDALDDEGLHLLLEDYRQLVRWHNVGTLDNRALREASNLAHLWLLDDHPLLQRVSDHYGAMLSFPDLQRTEALAALLPEDRPSVWAPDSSHIGNWVSRTAFRDDLACWVGLGDHTVSWSAFIKFVRNKMGGGHFDPSDRTRWQRELTELSRQDKAGGERWLASTMLALISSLIIAADGSGFVALARDEVGA